MTSTGPSHRRSTFTVCIDHGGFESTPGTKSATKLYTLRNPKRNRPGSGPEAGGSGPRKRPEPPGGSGAEAACESAACMPVLSVCMHAAKLLPSSSYEASGRADQVHRCHRLGSVFSCSSTHQVCMRNITIASVDASHDGDFCLRLSPSASA